MRRGQVALYLLMVLVGIFLIALLNVDAFDFVRGKNRAQNAGDAAALAAARIGITRICMFTIFTILWTIIA